MMKKSFCMNNTKYDSPCRYEYIIGSVYKLISQVLQYAVTFHVFVRNSPKLEIKALFQCLLWVRN